MIRPGVVMGFALAEARLMRRLVRYWVFIVLATLFAALNVVQLAVIHWLFSFGSASAASANPRYWMSNSGAWYVIMFLIGITFLAFDLRARDSRERIVEVLDAKPYSNLELLVGRFVGIFLASWVPTVIVILALAGGAWLFGSPIEPRSLVTFTIFMAAPAYVFWIGLVFLLTTLLRNRLLVAVASVLLVVAQVATSWFMPIWSIPMVDVPGGLAVPLPSDVAPMIIDGQGLLQRGAVCLFGIGLLFLAALLYQRRDDSSRPALAGAGAVTVLVALAGLGLATMSNRAVVLHKEAWRAAHLARADEPVPDVRSMRGRIAIDPGSRLDLDLVLSVAAPDAALETALFTLNPGIDVERVAVDGADAGFTHEDGLLEVTLPAGLPAGATAEIAIVASGSPTGEFAYFDAAMEPYDLRPIEGQVLVLGWDPLIFESDHVSLLPGTGWLPTSGPAATADGTPRTPDFFTVDLDVEVPPSWLVAGPGRREGSDGRFHFETDAPLPGVALVADRYDSIAVELEGVTLEVLLHPDHHANFTFFADASGEVEDWLDERLAEARDLGLAYPYDGLTLVEVPNRLRGFGGGWRMDTTLAQPSVILLRENSFPTARFDGNIAKRQFERAKDREGGVPEYKLELLQAFFSNDLNGGNPFIAAARSFLGSQTAGRGPAGAPMDFVLEQMTSRLLTDRGGYFSVHFFDRRFGERFAMAGQAMGSGDRISDSYAEVLTNMVTSTPEVWETVTTTSLDELDPWEDPQRTIDVYSLKGGAMARSLLDRLGREKSGEFIAALRERARGETYTRADVLAAGEAVGEDLADWLDLWLDGTRLPGFVVGSVESFRVRDPQDDNPRHQVLITVRNDEEASGLVRVEYRTAESGYPDNRSEPVTIGGHSARQIGVVDEETITGVRVVPYLSLNRQPFEASLPVLDTESITEGEPFVGAREVPWNPPDTDAIVVDDLDPGFSVEDGEGRGLLRVEGGRADETLDQGLPVAAGRPAEWSRTTRQQAWGKYRHTAVLIKAGQGQRIAQFAADIPDPGEWELEMHVPRLGGFYKTGTFHIEIVDDTGSREATLDASVDNDGWVSVGTYEIADGEVRVRLSDQSDGKVVVIADAVRWTPLGRGPSRDVARR